ncbi:MAG: hypothetical protein IPI67_30800 [Myxococcales bacterium]|nr:hypothetical protein [Myxococcales bacterium]
MLRSRSLAWIFALGVASVALGCDERSPPSEPPTRPGLPERPAAPAGDAAPGEATAAGDVDAGAEAKRLVAELRRSKLEVAPRRVPTQKLAFGKDRLAQLTETELVLRGLDDLKVLTRLPVRDPRRAATLSDGSVLVAGVSDLWRVPRDPKKAEHYSRLPLFPDSLLLGDRRAKNKLWVHHGIDPTLYPYELSADGRLETLDFIELERADQKAFALLKDGSYVYTAGPKLERFFPGGKRWSLDLPSGSDVWRILTTRRLDEIWLAQTDGRLMLTQLSTTRLVVKKTLELPGTFDLATNDTEIALLRLETRAQVDGAAADSGLAPRTWRLLVLDGSGKERMSSELPLDPATAEDDWVREITKNRGVVLSPSGSLVAVGGPTWLAVWSYSTQKQLLAP